MPSVALIGLQWGDEGKGKVSAYLSKGADLAVRFNGGSNAGHTVGIATREFKLHIIPAGGLFAKGAAIGPGVYVDLDVLVKEAEILKEFRGDVELYISPRAHVVLPLHKSLDALIEERRGSAAIGTTRRGIGPAAMDKYGRLGIRIADVLEEEELKEKLEAAFKVHGDLGGKADEVRSWLVERVSSLSRYVADVGAKIRDVLEQGGKVIFEGSQGTMLDIDHGTYPYVTSSNTIAAAAAIGSGISHKLVGKVMGVAKAYTTRVGSGPFPTEVEGEVAEAIRRAGGEYGTTTGRPRRIGWLDLVLLRYAALLNGADEIALTRLDTLSGVKRLKVCVDYELNGSEIEVYPASASELAKVRAKYEELDGWPRFDAQQVAKEGYGALPREARRYVEFVEENLGVPVSLIGIGPNVEEVVEK